MAVKAAPKQTRPYRTTRSSKSRPPFAAERLAPRSSTWPTLRLNRVKVVRPARSHVQGNRVWPFNRATRRRVMWRTLRPRVARVVLSCRSVQLREANEMTDGAYALPKSKPGCPSEGGRVGSTRKKGATYGLPSRPQYVP
jgi:hypothetical protein